MNYLTYFILIGIAFIIFLYILRKTYLKEISEIDAITWISYSLVGFIFVLIPESIDMLITATGVKYAPIAFLGIIILFLIIQNLQLMTKLYSIQKKQISLTQKIAMIEFKVIKSDKERNE